MLNLLQYEIITISVKMVITSRNQDPTVQSSFPSEYLFNSTEPVGHIGPMPLKYKLPWGKNHIVKFVPWNLDPPMTAASPVNV